MNAFRPGPYTGAAFVAHEAARQGYMSGDPTWCNLGQGQPETGKLAGGPVRLSTLALSASDEMYGPVGGTEECRQAIADHYNRLYRANHASRYGAQNVAIAAGGRLALLRVLAALSPVRLGYQIPDYMSFESLLETQAHRLVQIAVPNPHAGRGGGLSSERFADVIEKNSLSAFLLSNPCNPTGDLLVGDELDAIVRHACARACALMMDEFYSHYIYDEAGAPAASPVSAAAHVDDVERDPVLIIDGLTKNFRYPGWRLGWVLGPAHVIEQVIRVSAGLDGGASTIVQRATLDVLSAPYADRETAAMRCVFAQKRRVMLDALRKIGVLIHREPRGAFYAWGDLSALPAPLNDADAFFRSALERKVITVPGRLFDLNPGQRRASNPGFRPWMRFSFGPDMAHLCTGLERLETMVGR